MRASQFTVELPGFRGSLEDLVTAVHQRHLSLLELPLESLTGQLLRFVNQLEAHERLEGSVEWVDLAARLIRWKSFALLSAEEGRAEADAELRGEIDAQFREIERARIARLREFLQDRLLAAGGSLEGVSQTGQFRPELPEDAALFPSLWTLRQKFQTLRMRAGQRRGIEPLVYLVAEAEDTVEQMQNWVLQRLQQATPGDWIGTEKLFVEVTSLPRQVALFQAFLELAQTTILITQHPDEELFVALRATNN